MSISYFLVRPQAVFQCSDIIKTSMEAGLNINLISPLLISPSQAAILCSDIEDPTIRKNWSLNMEAGFSVLVVISCDNAIKRVLEVVGKEVLPSKNSTDTLRYIYGAREPIPAPYNEFSHNAIHKPNNEYEVSIDLPHLSGIHKCEQLTSTFIDMAQNGQLKLSSMFMELLKLNIDFECFDKFDYLLELIDWIVDALNYQKLHTGIKYQPSKYYSDIEYVINLASIYKIRCNKKREDCNDDIFVLILCAMHRAKTYLNTI